MSKRFGVRALYPAGSEAQAKLIGVSPGIVAGDHVFLTGVTGSLPDGTMPDTARAQFVSVFDKIGAVLAEAGVSHGAIVEMTSYHIDLAAHFDAFNAVRNGYVGDPFPAWTAVEVAGLRRAGALVEVRVVAYAGDVA